MRSKGSSVMSSHSSTLPFPPQGPQETLPSKQEQILLPLFRQARQPIIRLDRGDQVKPLPLQTSQGIDAVPWQVRQRTLFSPRQVRQSEIWRVRASGDSGDSAQGSERPRIERLLDVPDPALRENLPNDDPPAPSPPPDPDQLHRLRRRFADRRFESAPRDQKPPSPTPGRPDRRAGVFQPVITHFQQGDRPPELQRQRGLWIVEEKRDPGSGLQ